MTCAILLPLREGIGLGATTPLFGSSMAAAWSEPGSLFRSPQTIGWSKGRTAPPSDGPVSSTVIAFAPAAVSLSAKVCPVSSSRRQIGAPAFALISFTSPAWVSSQKADGTDAGAQGGISPTPVATDRTGDKPDQSGATRMGELLRGWALQRVLQLRQRLGGEEGQAPSGAGSETKGLRLEAVE